MDMVHPGTLAKYYDFIKDGNVIPESGILTLLDIQRVEEARQVTEAGYDPYNHVGVNA